MKNAMACLVAVFCLFLTASPVKGATTQPSDGMGIDAYVLGMSMEDARAMTETRNTAQKNVLAQRVSLQGVTWTAGLSFNAGKLTLVSLTAPYGAEAMKVATEHVVSREYVPFSLRESGKKAVALTETLMPKLEIRERAWNKFSKAIDEHNRSGKGSLQTMFCSREMFLALSKATWDRKNENEVLAQYSNHAIYIITANADQKNVTFMKATLAGLSR